MGLGLCAAVCRQPGCGRADVPQQVGAWPKILAVAGLPAHQPVSRQVHVACAVGCQQQQQHGYQGKHAATPWCTVSHESQVQLTIEFNPRAMNSPPSASEVSTNPSIHPFTYCPATRNPDFATQLSPDYLNDPTHCPADRPSHARSLFGLRAMDDDGGGAQ